MNQTHCHLRIVSVYARAKILAFSIRIRSNLTGVSPLHQRVTAPTHVLAAIYVLEDPAAVAAPLNNQLSGVKEAHSNRVHPPAILKFNPSTKRIADSDAQEHFLEPNTARPRTEGSAGLGPALVLCTPVNSIPGQFLLDLLPPDTSQPHLSGDAGKHVQ